MATDEKFDPMIVMIGKKLRQVREERKMSQPEIAALVRKTASAISQIEKGKIRGVSMLTILQLIDVLEIDPSSFFAEISLCLRWRKKKDEMQKDPQFARTMPILDLMFQKITGLASDQPPGMETRDIQF